MVWRSIFGSLCALSRFPYCWPIVDISLAPRPWFHQEYDMAWTKYSVCIQVVDHDVSSKSTNREDLAFALMGDYYFLVYGFLNPVKTAGLMFPFLAKHVQCSAVAIGMSTSPQDWHDRCCMPLSNHYHQKSGHHCMIIMIMIYSCFI